MRSRLEEAIGRATAAWVDASRRRARGVVVLAAAASVLSLAYTAGHLGINADTTAMLSDELPFRKRAIELKAAFPAIDDNLIVVIDADSSARAREATERLAARLKEEAGLFESVFVPGEGRFFEAHGLLLLETEQLEDLADRLAAAQPFLASLARDPTLARLAMLLDRAVSETHGGELPAFDLPGALERVAGALDAELESRRSELAWDEWVLGAGLPVASRRRVLFAKPVVDFSDLAPAREAIEALRRHAAALGPDPSRSVRVRITGDPALSYEEMELVRRQAAVAGLASFLMVALLLFVALRSVGFVGATLATLLAGLAWTFAFATAAVGHLNLISIAFAVLFIGLGVAFGLHFVIRYREQLVAGSSPEAALREAGRSVGSPLVLCATTTAVGFYAFVPTAYAGVAELGLIAGTGMFLSLVATLTLLPALLFLGALWAPASASARTPLEPLLPAFPLRRPGAVLAGAALVGLLGVAAMPGVRFDADPLNVRDPAAESVRAMRELLEESPVSPWTVNLLASDLARAREIAARLDALPEVERTFSVTDYVPSDQDEKLSILEDVALFLGPIAPEPIPSPPDVDRTVETLSELEGSLAALLDAPASAPKLARSVASLRGVVERVIARIRAASDPAHEVARLEGRVLGDLPDWLARLERALGTGSVRMVDLPPSLRDRFVAPDGRVRVEVFPRARRPDGRALEQFVDAVREVVPEAAGPAVDIVESARAIVDALRRAFTAAGLAIALLLWLLWRRISDTALVLAPLALAALLTAAASVIAGLPFNFADVIVLPLLLGIGVDSGIHLVHRHRTGLSGSSDLLHTGTARAVLFSALTVIASFGTLGFSSHRGMASLGQLLTLGIGFTLLANLLVLPALLTSLARRSGGQAAKSG